MRDSKRICFFIFTLLINTVSIVCDKKSDKDEAPTVTTSPVTGITSTTASGGGDVTDDGGADITARGVCWSTSQNPTIALSTKTSDGTGTGVFTSSITSLSPSTTYYVRAYTTNNTGMNYGNQVSFTTNSSTITDIDGNVYHTVTIGTQEWLVENLKTTKYRNGTAISNVTDNTQWSNNTAGAYCDHDNTASNSTTYGHLYNWYAVSNANNIAPTGWHVASDAEWTTLTTYLGGGSVAGGKLKEAGLAHWASPNTGATNETGFTALPGGYRTSNGAFYAIDYTGYWWSATETDATYAWYRYMYYDGAYVTRNYAAKAYGFSVRCVRD